METQFFDAIVNLSSPIDEKILEVELYFEEKTAPATWYPYKRPDNQDSNQLFVRLHVNQPLLLKWNDRFSVQKKTAPEFRVEGRILNPFKDKIKPGEAKKRPELLQHLSASEIEMLLAKTQEGGIHGLSEQELNSFCSISKEILVKLSRELEEEGKLKILSFSPLHLFAQSGFDFLCEQILAYLSQFHSKNPGETGVLTEKIGKRFKLHPRILSLAVKQLSRNGKVTIQGDQVAQSNFRVQISTEEEKLLQSLEEMSLQGELHSVSFEDLKKRFRLSTKNLNRLLNFLIERNKIVKGKDGFIVHSSWLEELIQKLKNSGKKDLSVFEFKRMTGLSRKYAIPLLELLDQMGVTRRRGPGREIL